MNETRNNVRVQTERITENDLKDLPEVVQKYLRFSGVVGKMEISKVRLKQAGEFRLKPEEKFRWLKAEQSVDLNRLSFFWKGKIGPVTAIDRFENGKGKMTIRLLGLIPLATSQGAEIDKGELVRFLAEGVWFPTLFLQKQITWKEVDSQSARAFLTINNLTVNALFVFDEQFRVKRIVARRYMENKGTFTLQEWEIQIVDYKDFHGFTIPRKSRVVWKLKEGDFCWYQPEILEIQYE